MNNSQTHEPLFSVVIPTYNYADYIRSAIDSVLAQTEECEVIVIDDGSTDNTRDVVAEYAGKIKYIYQENKGVSAARNNGVSVSSGQYILFLDADDCLLNDALSKIKGQVLSYPETDCFIAGRISIDPLGRKKTTIPPLLSNHRTDNFKNFLRKKLGSSNIAAVKRHVFKRIIFPESINNNEDIVLLAHILACYKCRSIQQPIIEVHQHELSLRHNIQSVMDSTYKVIDELFNSKILSEEFMSIKKEISSRILLSKSRSLYLSGRKQEARQLYRKAISLYPNNIFRLSYLKKYIKSFF